MLHVAVARGHDAVVVYLVSKGGDPHHALAGAAMTSLPLLTVLVEYLGADCKANVAPFKETEEKTITALLADPSRASRTALFWAVQAGNLECVRYLLQSGRCDVNLGPVLHAAAASKRQASVAVMEALLEAKGVEVDQSVEVRQNVEVDTSFPRKPFVLMKPVEVWLWDCTL